MSFRTWTARAAAGVAAFASCLILAGCGGDRSAGRDETNEIVWWTFGEEDGDIKAMRSAFDRLGIPGMKLKVVRYGFEELHDKLLAVFTSGGRGAPDLCDVEISQIGRFYKHDPIGFMDLTERIRNSPFYDDQIIERAAPYSYKGRLYGIDADMTLSMIYYRRDIFEQHGINPDFPTWDDFIRAGLKLKESGIYMLQIPNGANPDNYNEDFVPQLLIQQGGGYFDKDGNITVNNEIGVRTISFINDIVNKHKIAVATGADIFDAPYYAPYLKGEIAAMIMPNWMLVFFMYGNMPELAGKWGIAPLPAWTPGGRRTSTAGGGTLVITRFTKHP